MEANNKFSTDIFYFHLNNLTRCLRVSLSVSLQHSECTIPIDINGCAAHLSHHELVCRFLNRRGLSESVCFSHTHAKREKARESYTYNRHTTCKLYSFFFLFFLTIWQGSIWIIQPLRLIRSHCRLVPSVVGMNNAQVAFSLASALLVNANSLVKVWVEGCTVFHWKAPSVITMHSIPLLSIPVLKPQQKRIC